MKHNLIIAIDGPAGSGKSTVAKLVASKLRVPYIDTGAMYRAVTLKAMRAGVSFSDVRKLVMLAKSAVIRLEGKNPKKQKVFLDGEDVSHEIRIPELTKNVFHIAQEPNVRREMVKKQKAMGKKNGAVMEGRDIGTVVFPKADYKFYFEADPKVRAMRRFRELRLAGSRVTFASVLRDLKARDKTDYHRRVGPLRRAKDAFLIDTTRLTINQVADKILRIIQSKSLKGSGLNRLSLEK